MKKKMLLVALALLSVAGVEAKNQKYNTDSSGTMYNRCPTNNFSKKTYYPGDVVACLGVGGSNGTAKAQSSYSYGSKLNLVSINQAGTMPGYDGYWKITVNNNVNKKTKVTISQTTYKSNGEIIIRKKYKTITVAPRPNSIEAGGRGETKTKNTR